MKIGIMSAAFPELNLDQLLEFLGQNGFGSVEIVCWPGGEAKDRKYGGVVHVDVETLNPGRIDEIQGKCTEQKVEISALGYYANPLQKILPNGSMTLTT